MEILDKRLNDKGKNWRHVFKALVLLDYLLMSGSENVWNYFHDNIYIVKTLKEFQYMDDAHVDQGINVRQKAKEITALLLDEVRMRERRRRRFDDDARAAREPDDYSDEAGRRRRQRENEQRSQEDRELEQALEESRRMAEADEERRRREAQGEADLRRAIELSEEEERKRKQNESLINLDQESTPSLQPQYTSMMTFQPTGYNPFFAAQMQQQEMMQQQYLQQQEYQRQLALQQAAQQYQYMMTQQQQQPAMMPQPTGFGSNNPWLAPSSSTPAPAPAPEPELDRDALKDAMTDTLINLDGPEDASPVLPPRAEPAPQPARTQPPRAKISTQHAELDRLLAQGDGIDTFGNTGDMRLGHNAWALQQQRTGVSTQAGHAAADGARTGATNPFS